MIARAVRRRPRSVVSRRNSGQLADGPARPAVDASVMARAKSIIVGYDGSDAGHRALDVAADLVGYGSTLAVVGIPSDPIAGAARRRLPLPERASRVRALRRRHRPSGGVRARRGGRDRRRPDRRRQPQRVFRHGDPRRPPATCWSSADGDQTGAPRRQPGARGVRGRGPDRSQRRDRGLRGGCAATATPPAAELAGEAGLLRGIPQQGTALGSPDAPVTLVEYADLQCPYCAQWARDAFPELVRDYVRTGRVRIVFRGLAFLGPDSDAALRAALAAGQQRRRGTSSTSSLPTRGPRTAAG